MFAFLDSPFGEHSVTVYFWWQTSDCHLSTAYFVLQSNGYPLSIPHYYCQLAGWFLFLLVFQWGQRGWGRKDVAAGGCRAEWSTAPHAGWGTTHQTSPQWDTRRASRQGGPLSTTQKCAATWGKNRPLPFFYPPARRRAVGWPAVLALSSDGNEKFYRYCR